MEDSTAKLIALKLRDKDIEIRKLKEEIVQLKIQLAQAQNVTYSPTQPPPRVYPFWESNKSTIT